MIPVRVGSATDVGRVRSVNEDSSFAGRDLFAVADGMGGHAAGDAASAIAVTYLAQLAQLANLQPADIQRQLTACNRQILALADADRERAGMGTTVAGLGVTQLGGSDHWVVFNVGDSRVYRFVNATLTQVTVDHSEVAELVAAGSIAANDARTHPKRNVVTRVLGMRPDPVIDVWVFPPTPGERFVVCSDGLSSELSDDQIAAVLRTEPLAPAAATALVAAALEAGGRDNVTVLVVDHVAAEGELAEDTLQRQRPGGAAL